MRFIFITMDGNHGAALREAARLLARDQGVRLDIALYDSTKLREPADFARLAADAATADFVFGSMLFGEEFVRPLEQVLGAAQCPVAVITSNPTLIRLTRLGKLSLAKRDEDQEPGVFKQWAQKLRGKRGGHGEGHRQLAFLRNIGQVMKHIPGKARDLHTYIAVHQYWMHGSAENLRRMLCMFISRYVPGHEQLPILDPIEYPDVALLHPDADAPFATLAEYEQWLAGRGGAQRAASPPAPSKRGTVGLLSLRTVALSGNTAHLNALFRALESRGLEVRMAYGAGLDFRPAIDQFFQSAAGRPTTDHRPSTAGATSAEPHGLRKLVANLRSSVVGRPAAGPPARHTTVDVLLNGAGFSLIGGMAESRPEEARATLEALDIGYLDMIPLAFQQVEEWRRDDTGLSPIQVAMNVAIPELDAAAEPLVYGGPSAGSDAFVPLDAEIARAADRIARRVALHRVPNREKRIAVALFNFPPTLGNVGTAAYLDVFASLHRLLQTLAAEGYSVDVPESVEALRSAVVDGNSQLHGTDGNVAAYLDLADYRRLFPHHVDIEPFWGPAPGELLTDGKRFQILGAQFGNVFVAIQPSFGYERDPMRLLMAKDAAPHHGFAAFYTYLDKVFAADAVLHFGTHGALEFMPGKQVGLTADCWPHRLLGGMPNFYYYSVNNPSEATIAKRRGAATLVSYMVPPLQQAGLYKGLRLLKDALDTYRNRPDAELLADIRAQAAKLGIGTDDSSKGDETYIAALAHELIQVEQRMIPVGLHVLGAPSGAEELADVLALVAAFYRIPGPDKTLPELVAAQLGYDYEATRAALSTDRAAQARWEQIDATVRAMTRGLIDGAAGGGAAGGGAGDDPYGRSALRPYAPLPPPLAAYLTDLLGRMQDEQELRGIVHALEGGYIAPSPGNDVVRNPAVVPTGRNIHGLDPFRVPTRAAQIAGERLMVELVERLTASQGHVPETVALVLWGTDNLKSDGEGVAQALALLGARPVEDELGKVSDVALIPLDQLNRPRVDIVVTVSGIFRDLLCHQMQLLDKAVRLAAAADEPIEFNFVRKHALEQVTLHGGSAADHATRVFSNAPGSYGANVNHVVESGNWEQDGELAEAFVSRKSFAYGPRGTWREARGAMEAALATAEATFQNIDSFEVGISDIDHYYENLGGVTKTIEKLRGTRPPVLVADAISTTGRLSTLEQMVRLESRAKLLNPKWYEAMLSHGYQGVHEIEARVGNTYGWSATTGAVEGWVYQGVAETYLLDEAMRARLTELNPHSAAAVARRLLEANNRGFWDADEATIAQLQQIYADLEDRMEGVKS